MQMFGSTSKCKEPQFNTKTIKVFKDGVFIKDCFGTTQVAELTGKNYTTIRDYLKHKTKNLDGWYVCYKDSWSGETSAQFIIGRKKGREYITRGSNKKTVKYLVSVYKDGLLLSTHEGCNEVCKVYGINRNALNHVRRGKQNMTAGYTFDFKKLE